MSNEDPKSDSAARRDRVAPGTGRRVTVLAGMVAIVLVGGFVATHVLRLQSTERLAAATVLRAAAPAPVDVVTVQSAPPTDILALPGTAAAWYDSTIYARVDGYVGKWFVDIGDHVQEGQVLATIETPELDARLVAAQAQLRAAQAEVEVRKAQARFARSTYDRWKDSPKGVVSEQEREDKKAAYESAQARSTAAAAQVNLAEAEIDRLTASTRFKEVRAPYNGIIVQRHIDIGNLVTAGSTSGNTPLYRLTQNDPIRVFVDVPQNAAASMKIGTSARISMGNQQGSSFDGTITRTANAVDMRTRTFRVEVDLPNPNGTLVPGAYLQVAFHRSGQGVSQVPAAALVFRTEGPQVAVVNSSGTIEFRNVTIARDNGNVIVLASGVSPGEKVALNISSQIADGEKVRSSEHDDHVTSTARTER